MLKLFLIPFLIFSISSSEDFTAWQYRLNAKEKIAATTTRNDEPIVPGQGRQETSAEKS